MARPPAGHVASSSVAANSPSPDVATVITVVVVVIYTQCRREITPSPQRNYTLNPLNRDMHPHQNVNIAQV